MSRAPPPGTPLAAARRSPLAAANAAALAGTLPAVPFHGQHQAGILPQPQRATAVVSFDATAEAAADLDELFQTVTGRARFLTAGGTPPPVGINGPPSDSGMLGPTVVPDGLTVTFGVGSTLFDDRYGLAGQAPARLTPMRSFPNDDLDPAQTGGDLILQLSAGNRDAVLHALRDITKNTLGGMQVNWRIDGFASPPARPARSRATTSGSWTASPTRTSSSAEQLDSLVWIQPGTRASRPGPRAAATSWSG